MPPALTRACLTALLVLAAAHPRAQRGAERGDWPHHGADAGSTKYSALDLITRDNVSSLQVVWRRPAVEASVRAAHPGLVVPRNFRTTPLKAGRLLYASNGLGLAEAFDPATGRTAWTQAVEPADLGGAGASRNLAYWAGSGSPRVFNVRGAHLWALDARTGKAVEGFGDGGRVDLLAGLGSQTTSFRWSAPGPLVVSDVVVIGGQGWTDSGTQADLPPGDIRPYDVRTGRLRRVVAPFG
jgi:quinoprotein glucose dehydrogenase